MAAPDGTPYLPGRHAIEGYGAGGFRFAGMAHRGSLLALPSGLYGWPPRTAAEIDEAALARLFAEAAALDLVVLGTGERLHPLPAALRARFQACGLMVEPMATPHAAHTYNVLLGEGRRIAAGLVAVD